MTTQSIIDQAKKEKRLILTEEESKTLLADANIRTTKIAAASTRDEAINKANEIGYPVVVKIDSTDINLDLVICCEYLRYFLMTNIYKEVETL